MRQNTLTSSALLFRYGDTNDVFPIGGLVAIGETPIVADSRHIHQLVNFVRKPHDNLWLFRVLKRPKKFMPSRISMYFLDVKAG